MYKDAMYEEIIKRRDPDKARNDAQEMQRLYGELESTLDREQKELLKKYSDAYRKFMLGVCDTAYAQGFENGQKSKDI
jgi:hypothetical protein